MAGIVLLIGRVVFSFFFIYSGFNHLTKLSMMSQYAGSVGIPAPTLAIAVTGLMLLGGGLSILLGVKPKVGAALLVLFLVPAAIMVHKFWGIADPMMAANQAAHFWKNIALAGGALMIFGLADSTPTRWPYSLGGGRSTPAL
jgi:putative oxidoreductase